MNFLLLLVGLNGTFAYADVDKGVNQITDIVDCFKYREKDWRDFIGICSSGPYFNVDLAEKGFFNTTGVAYLNIEKTFFRY